MRYLIMSLALVVTACASTSARNGNIAIDTISNGQPLPGANCLVSNGAGQWNVTTPATAPVGSPSGDLRVVCNKQGYRTSEIVYRPSGAAYGNPSVGVGVGGGTGGHVGVGLGLGFPIGLFGGAAGYPSQITVEMNPA